MNTARHDFDNEASVTHSLTSVVMMLFQYSGNAAHHCQLLECLMALKQNVLKDLLCVIAYGTSSARSSCAKLLFHYWPPFSTSLFDRKALICKIASGLGEYVGMSGLYVGVMSCYVTLGNPTPFVCQRDLCPNSGNAEAAKVCYDHCISITFATDCPPPLYLCIECANEIHREHPNQMFCDILHPMQQVSTVCENKNCRACDKLAVSICFSTECASYNSNHPIRYCAQCDGNRHNNRRGSDHVVHRCVPLTWSMDNEMQTYMVEAIVSLLKEAKQSSGQADVVKETVTVSVLEQREKDGDQEGGGGAASSANAVQPASLTMEERNLLGRYGVWLLVGRCSPADVPPASTQILGRLLAMLFHWFHVTAYSYDGNTYIHTYLHYATFPFLGSPFLLPGGDEGSIEKLKTEHVCQWLRGIKDAHYALVLACLLPHPPEYARVGGHWDALASRTSHLKDGLHRLFCLVPYEIITPEIWDHVMPYWMDAVASDVPDKELHELKVILGKLLDTDVSPLGFDPPKMYCFVAARFESESARVQERALRWLQVLTVLDITIPLALLFDMFRDGVRVVKGAELTGGVLSTKTLPQDDTAVMLVNEPATEHNLSCCILMLDILLKQMELQDVDKHTGIGSNLCRDVCRLLKCMVTASWISGHICSAKSECSHCEMSIMWHQLSLQLIKYLSPVNAAQPPDVSVSLYSHKFTYTHTSSTYSHYSTN